jgi:hypothetical protein
VRLRVLPGFGVAVIPAHDGLPADPISMPNRRMPFLGDTWVIAFERVRELPSRRHSRESGNLYPLAIPSRSPLSRG